MAGTTVLRRHLSNAIAQSGKTGCRNYATPSSRPASRLGPTLDLESFIRRSKVMSLYRSFVRATYKIEDPQTRKETLQYFRSEFESNRGVTDSSHVSHLLSMGRTMLGSIERSVNQKSS
ncbi:hypothetical protein MCOR07_010114 [Pyricularia oryzae]|uniref:LYR motif-containing protein 2 n=1 Tax=Pyricularia grisea TaxID=148305 RepID=A0ABQ8NFT4_PYRGI|nr:hypothetical protein MCOR19_010358 [Pyricularia oryzae]KAI6296354.1 hypothetical protein MCOR33_007023 [Pyricularia grisea]KAI6281784.1 hypothetical protein MCOR26_003124 [Pyricularia oryzae]KAI6325830.1 hypothetical protein MCOR34_001042 [Pyricularia oryzae]KAI6339842.1 hypothetical protein MCOR28_006986 [Pyricularia oryzae]